jgi:hypothetical protein
MGAAGTGERGDAMKRKDTRGRTRHRQVIRLADLAPRKDVKGGSGKLLFGEHLEPLPSEQIVERSEGSEDRSARRDETQR